MDVWPERLLGTVLKWSELEKNSEWSVYARKSLCRVSTARKLFREPLKQAGAGFPLRRAAHLQQWSGLG